METRQRPLTPELFKPVGDDYRDNERIAGPSIGFWKDSWHRLQKNKAALVGLVVIVALITVAYVAPLFSPYTTDAQDMTEAYLGPSADHLMGTDMFGRDMFVRVWEGMRVSLYIALLAAFFDLVIGVPFGAISGLLGGRVDGVMQRIIEILNGIPNLVVAILAMVIFQPGITTISIAIGLTGWTYMARIVRGKMLQLRDQEFALASRSLGAGRFRLVWKHLIPNSLGPIIISVMFTIPDAIFAESFLSFIGLGIQIPEASLGSLISDGTKYMQFHPYLLWFPTAILCLIMISFTLFGDGLRDALDPRMRK
jgi:oligopeptide transport system permease protein